MDMEAFRKHLKRRGKKDHVVDGLIAQVQRFADFLEEQLGGDLLSATPDDFEAYAEWLEEQKKGQARISIRGIGLYFAFTGRKDLSKTASNIRQTAIAKTRKAFSLKDFRGVNQEQIRKLADEGIVNVKQMIEAGKTPALREALADKTGIPLESILEYVKLSDLARIPGIKTIRARLYFDAGIDTLEKMAASDPEELREMTLDFVERTGFDGIAPLLGELQFSVAKAKELPKLIKY
jgi:hypothetical protein